MAKKVLTRHGGTTLPCRRRHAHAIAELTSPELGTPVNQMVSLYRRGTHD